MQILIVGTGYVGLVTGTCFADMGHHVTCLDIDIDKIARMSNGEVPIYEPGLEEKLKRNLKAGRIHFTNSYSEAIPNAKVIFLALPTPSTESGEANLSFVESAARSIGKELTSHAVITNKSTVPIGTAEKVKGWIQEELDKRGVTITFDVASNPEFLKEGDAVNDCMKPYRVIVGVEKPEVAEVFKKIYAPFTLSRDRLMVMDITSAEMAKYAANAMLATRISFMNEMACLCEDLGADIGEVRKALGADPRIGHAFLYAGVGFGGSCLPKDIRALQVMTDGETPILEAVEKVNERQREVLLGKIVSHFGDLNGKRIALWGVAFKPETDDVRDAPSLALIEALLERGAELALFDPIAHLNDDRVTWTESEIEAAKDADGIVLLTEWKQFRSLDFNEVLQVMRGNAFFDGRNQYKPAEMAERGFDYFSIGRAPSFALAEIVR